MIIRNQEISGDVHTSRAEQKQTMPSKAKRRKTNKTPKLSVMAAYFGVFVFVVSIITVGYQAPQQSTDTPVALATETPSTSPASRADVSVDQLVATDVAANLAEQTNMPVAANVANLSVSLAAKNELAQTDNSAIIKPQIVQPTASSREIITYIAKESDTVPSVAAQYGIAADTLRWANNLTADALKAGKELVIPPVDGVVYTVKAGDTADTLASRYKASKERIVSFNDLEISGPQVGSRIVIPGGVLPEEQRPGYQAPLRSSSTGSYAGTDGYRVNSSIRSASAGNRYAWGNCTWYAYERRVQMGRPVGSFWGNAKTWAYYAAGEGYVVNRTPVRGAILVDMAGYYGHVAIVEEVLGNGNIVISEMNNYAYGGFGVVNKRTISAGQASAYQYIH